MVGGILLAEGRISMYERAYNSPELYPRDQTDTEKNEHCSSINQWVAIATEGSYATIANRKDSVSTKEWNTWN